MIATLSVIFGYPFVVLLLSPSAQLFGPVVSLLDVLAITVAVIVSRVRGPAGGRVAALVAAWLLPGLIGDIPFAGNLTADTVAWFGSLVLTVLVWPLAIVSWKRQAQAGGTTAAARAGR